MWDKLACIRSLVTVDEHSDTLVMTGYPDRVNRTAEHPSFGSVISKLRSETNGAIPPFVSLRGMSRGSEPGYLGIAHRPFTPSGPGNANLKLANGVSLDRLDDRKALLAGFDDTRRDIDASGTMRGMDSYATKAIEMVTAGAVRTALDIKKEDKTTLDRYKGVEQFLTARRLVEAGVGCVTLSIGGWDTHGQNFQTLKKQLPKVDQGIANLISDLHDRGMADDVITVMWGEFGRTPKINSGAGPRPLVAGHVGPDRRRRPQDGAGRRREHRQGRAAQGPSAQRAARPQHHLPSAGHRPGHDLPQRRGRPMYVLDDREPVKELLG